MRDDIEIRPYRPPDLEALAALTPGRSAAALAEHLDDPGLDPGRDVRLALLDGRILAGRDVRVMARGDEARLILESTGPTAAAAWATEAPRALFAWMLERSEAILVERGRQAGLLQARAGPDDAPARALFARFGLSEARRLWSMEHRAPGSVGPSAPPDGVSVRPYAPGQHDEAWRSAFNEAFADHWGGWMQMSRLFWRRYLARPAFRPELSLVAWAGDEIAGFCHCRLDGAVGTIRYVGVRPGWRRQGLGEALTRQGLTTLAAAGAERVTLGVDATNTTGAQTLYQRLGFETTGEQVMYRRELTP
ncbi:MAG TPA: GNAT family N-acetyltransferase [Chloroflexota bacterium]